MIAMNNDYPEPIIEPAQCEEWDYTKRCRCIKPKGHKGMHLHIDASGSTAWGWGVV